MPTTPDTSLSIVRSTSVCFTLEIQYILGEYLRCHRNVRIKVASVCDGSEIDALTRGEAQVAILRDPDRRFSPEIACTPLYSELLMLAVSFKSELAGCSEIAIGSLTEVPFVIVPERSGSDLSKKIWRLCHANGVEPTHAAVASREMGPLDLVEMGAGVAIVPASMGQNAPPGVKLVPLKGEDFRTTLTLAYRQAPQDPVASFIETITKHFGRHELGGDRTRR